MSSLILPRPSTHPDLYRGKYAASIYAASNSGLWCMADDLTNLYQDPGGVVQATAAGQPIGMILDRKRGLVRGPEMFSTTLPTNPLNANWSYQEGTFSLGVSASYNYASSHPRGAIQLPTVARRYYEVIFTVAAVTGGIGVTVGSGGILATSGFRPSGTYRVVSLCDLTGLGINVQTGPNTLGSVTIHSVRELPGSHPLQTAAVSRPYLRQDASAYNVEFDGIDDFLTAASAGGVAGSFFFCSAICLGRVGATQTLYSDAGTNTGYRVRINASNQLEFSAGNGSGYVSVVTPESLALDQLAVLTCWHDGAQLHAQIDSGAVAQAAFALASAGNSTATIGRDNGVASSYFKGRIYGLVSGGAQVDAMHRTNIQQYMHHKIGGLS